MQVLLRVVKEDPVSQLSKRRAQGEVHVEKEELEEGGEGLGVGWGGGFPGGLESQMIGKLLSVKT